MDFSAALHSGDRPGVAVTLSLQKHQAKMVIPQEQLEAAEQDTIRRAQLRTSLKRTIDRMTFKPNDVVSTKMVRASVTDGGFFRIQQGIATYPPAGSRRAAIALRVQRYGRFAPCRGLRPHARQPIRRQRLNTRPVGA